MSRKFSTASLRLLATNIEPRLDPSAMDSVLDTLAHIDQQIHQDFASVNSNLAAARSDARDLHAELEASRAENIRLRSQLASSNVTPINSDNSNSIPSGLPGDCDCRLFPATSTDGQKISAHHPFTFISSEHSVTCSQRAALSAADPPVLVDLLLARDDAARNQAALVARLKADHTRLAALYDALRDRYDRLRSRPDSHNSSPLRIPRHTASTQQPCPTSNPASNWKNTSNPTPLSLLPPAPPPLPSPPRHTPKSATDLDQHQAATIRNLSERVCRASAAAQDLAGQVRRKLAAVRAADARVEPTTPVNKKRQTVSIKRSENVPIATHGGTPVKQNASIPSTALDTFESALDEPCGLKPHQSGSIGGRGLRVLSQTTSTQAAVLDEYDVDAPTFDTYCVEFPSDTASESPAADGTRETVPYTRISATTQLMRMMAVQQDAHDNLRETVAQLTAELERIDPNMLANAAATKEALAVAERRVSVLEKDTDEKDRQIGDMRRQLNKVLAEYEAVSIAHSYSNAELSKIRAGQREKVKMDRLQAGERRNTGERRAAGERANTRVKPKPVLDGVENLLHHRKIHFR